MTVPNHNTTSPPAFPFPKENPLDYYGAAEPPVRWWRSHLSGLSEPPRLITGYLAFSGSNP